MNTEQTDTAQLSGDALTAEWERLKKKNLGMPRGSLLVMVYGTEDAMRRDIAKWTAGDTAE